MNMIENYKRRILLVLLVSISFTGGCSVLNAWVTESAGVARQEFGPSTALKKYEWFKDASSQLDKKRADIAVHEASIKNLERDYAGKPRSQWASDDRAQRNQLEAEASGIKASFNQLAAEYNSGMAKFNYSFANQGKLPEGATTPLPREYKTYLTR